MKLKKLFAATILILSPLVIAAVCLTIPNLVLGLILFQGPVPEVGILLIAYAVALRLSPNILLAGPLFPL
jgi:hypothetical protein